MTYNKRIVEVVPHDPNWSRQYKEEAERITNILDKEIAAIHHIGSTAIPNISAKPIIDILIEVTSIERIDSYNLLMESIGYIPKGEYGIIGRRFFTKGENPRTHHLHIFEAGNLEIERHLNFRDYMIAHQLEAEEYSQLKAQLAEKYRYDIDAYIAGKDSFIKSIDKKAGIWRQNN